MDLESSNIFSEDNLNTFRKHLRFPGISKVHPALAQEALKSTLTAI